MDRRIGRLIEIRVQSIRTQPDALLFTQEVRAVASRTAPTRVIICADHRAVPIYPQIVVNQLISLFSAINPHIERAGLLIAPTNATFSMQMDRILREAHNPLRRWFYDPDEMAAWLAEALTESEATRMRTFLARTAPRGGLSRGGLFGR